MTKRDRTIVAVFACVGILAAYWFVVLGPQRSEAARLGDQVTAAEQRRDAARTQALAAEASRAAYADNYAAVTRVGKAVPTDDDVPSLVFQLETAARKAGIDFRSIRIEGGAAAPATGAATDPATAGATPPPGTEPGPGGLTKLPFKLTFEGSFFDLRRFLRLAESFTRVRAGDVKVRGRLLSIDGVSLEPGRDGLPDIKASLVASAYLAPNDPSLPKPGAPAPAGASAAGTTSAAAATPSTDSASAATPTASGANQ